VARTDQERLRKIFRRNIPMARSPRHGTILIYGMMKLQQLIKYRRGHWPDRAIGPTVPDGI
jgi:hypothetical protein